MSVKQSVALVRSRVQVGGLDLDVTDPLERTTKYIYDEIFEGRTYAHPNVKLPEHATIIDVGANIGLFAIWAAREYRPKTILAYEASPTTHDCLVENVARNIDAAKTGTTTTSINLAVSREADRELTLHQPPWVAGLSTVALAVVAVWLPRADRRRQQEGRSEEEGVRHCPNRKSRPAGIRAPTGGSRSP